MPVKIILFFFIFTLLPAAQAAEPLALRLANANDNAEQVSNELLLLPPASLSSEDWLVLAEAQLRLRNKEAAMDAISHVFNSEAPAYLQAHAYLLKAQVYGILYRDTAIAITQLERAEHLLQDATDSNSLTLYSDVLQNFAQAYNQLGNIPKAIPYAERSLALAIRQQQAESELKARITLGRLTLQNNAYLQAFGHLNQALMLATELQDEDALASIHLRLGMAYRKIEYYEAALQHLLQAKQLYHQLKRDASYTYTLIYIAETYLEDSATATEAASYLTEALAQARQQNDLLRVGIATLGLGRLAVLQQQPDLALQYFNEAQQLFRQQNVQTYLQETNLALAELLIQRQQYPDAQSLLQELDALMPQAATYLRYRHFGLKASLAAQQHDWQQAYDSLSQTNTLRFEQQAEQNKLQLDLMDLALTRAESDNQQQAALILQQQLNQQQQRDIYLLLSAVLLLLLTLAVIIVWFRRRQFAASLNQVPIDPAWTSFCHRLQQHTGGGPVSLLAVTTILSQQLKQHYGEQRLQLTLQHFLQQLSPETVLASCVYDDVLWLAVSGQQEHVGAFQAGLVQQLQQQLPARYTDLSILSMHLPLQHLLTKPWLTTEISALREALWLGWALCETLPKQQQRWLMTLNSTQSRACEWSSNVVRQDLLNAIRLGSIQLECNGNVLPATVADSLT